MAEETVTLAPPRWAKRADFIKVHQEHSPTKWDRIFAAGTVRTRRVGRNLLIDLADVDRYIESCPPGFPAAAG